MDNATVTKIQELIQIGEKLVPEGGMEFSGYNAKMQSQYLLWRKNCLDVLGKLGEKGTPFRTTITSDENGTYFYQTSAQSILDVLKHALTVASSTAKNNAAPAPATHSRPSSATEKKEEVKNEVKSEPIAATQQVKQPQPVAKPIVQQTSVPSTKKVFVITNADNQFSTPLSNLLKEIGIDEVVYVRTAGSSDALLSFVEQHSDCRFAFFLLTQEESQNTMFELGYLIGKLGTNRVCCIHDKDMRVPNGIPGILQKEIVVKLEEVSLSLIKDLKAAGYAVSI